MDCYARARALIDAAHAADPKRLADGRPAELVYADRMEAWVARLVPDAPPWLCLAARAQHLERWTVPRSAYPAGTAGYHAWRRTLYTRQAERAAQLLREAGLPAPEIAQAATCIAKVDLKTNPGTQALEDAACLVFLESELEAFAATHVDTPRDKVLGILRKTWAKMSPAARDAARRLPLTGASDALLREAIGAPST